MSIMLYFTCLCVMDKDVQAFFSEGWEGEGKPNLLPYLLKGLRVGGNNNSFNPWTSLVMNNTRTVVSISSVTRYFYLDKPTYFI